MVFIVEHNILELQIAFLNIVLTLAIAIFALTFVAVFKSRVLRQDKPENRNLD